MGNQDWRNMLVSKLIQTGSGQCHSLPLLYLCIMEQLNGKASLSLSPNHSYIQYFDEKGKRHSFETTNGHFVSQEWMMQPLGVSVSALKKSTYLDTLSSRKLFAYCLGDLLLGYTRKVGYDAFSANLIKTILEIDNTNIIALSKQAQSVSNELNRRAYAAGSPTPEQLGNYPALQKLYNDLMKLNAQLDNIGALTMPPDIYKQWLKSMDNEMQEEHDKKEYDNLLREMKKLKNIKPTFKKHSKEITLLTFIPSILCD